MKTLGSPRSAGKISFEDLLINEDSCYNKAKKEFIVPKDGFYSFMADATLMGPPYDLMFSYLECKANGVRTYYMYDSETNNRGKSRHMSAVWYLNLKKNDIVTLTNGKEGTIYIAADQPFLYTAIYVPSNFQRYWIIIVIVLLGFIAVIKNIEIFSISWSVLSNLYR